MSQPFLKSCTYIVALYTKVHSVQGHTQFICLICNTGINSDVGEAIEDLNIIKRAKKNYIFDFFFKR